MRTVTPLSVRNNPESFFPERAVVPLPRQEAPTMEYLVTMTTHVPDGTSEEAVGDVRARDAARSRELAAAGHLLRLWRPPLPPAASRTLPPSAAAYHPPPHTAPAST